MVDNKDTVTDSEKTYSGLTSVAQFIAFKYGDKGYIIYGKDKSID